MLSTMQDAPLTVGAILRHGLALYPDSEVLDFEPGGSQRRTFAEIGARVAQLAGALRDLGISPGMPVGTFLWNTSRHLECYLAVPAMGAVLNTVNVRLYPEQIVYIVNHAGDSVVIVEPDLLETFASLMWAMPCVKHVIVTAGVGATPYVPDHVALHVYDELLAGRPEVFDWPDTGERSAAAICYTSGTTGDPKGVVYSHRSTYLHTAGVCVANVYGMSQYDRVLPVVPMFHANAWGLPYAAWMSGADLLMPGRYLQAERLVKLIETERATFAAGVPTVWNDVLTHTRTSKADISSLRMVVAGGSAVPLSLMQAFHEQHRVRLVQGWGMTETSPVAAVAQPPKHVTNEAEQWAWRARTGRIVAGVECRVVDDSGAVLAADGRSVGEFECRGPWVTASYHESHDPSKFRDGWLRTGDVGTLDEHGFMLISDRTKDLIKSGGEWISSVELENALMSHPAVREAAVIAVPDARWQERPLAVVTWHREAYPIDELASFLATKVARWQVPERWSESLAIPRTSVGKFDKKVLRERYATGQLDVLHLAALPARPSR